MSSTAPQIAVAIVVVGVFLLILPIIILASRGRLPLQLGALLLCCLGLASLAFAGVAGLGSAGVSIMIALPFTAAMWFASLFCAVAAWNDAAHERRTKEMTLRLLTNDAHGLGKLDDHRIGWLG